MNDIKTEFSNENKVNDGTREILIKAWAEAVVEQVHETCGVVATATCEKLVDNAIAHLQKYTNDELEKELKRSVFVSSLKNTVRKSVGT